MIPTHSQICSSVITRGGAKRILSPCVGLARSPLSRIRRQTSYASNAATQTQSLNNNRLSSWKKVGKKLELKKKIQLRNNVPSSKQFYQKTERTNEQDNRCVEKHVSEKIVKVSKSKT